jgi:DHA1 family bicyclomycin/chloramphenicol resistance-like MFS transporter
VQFRSAVPSTAERSAPAAATSTGDQTVAHPGRPVRLLLILGGLSALGPASIDLYVPGIPSIADDFAAAAWSVQLTIGIFLFGLGVGQLISGPLSDQFGRRRPMLTAIVVFFAASIACGLAPSVHWLVGARLLQGLAAAAGVVISRAVIRDLYGGATAARYLSRLMLIYGLAPVLAPVVGGQILAVTSWRGLFVVLGVFALAMFVITYRALPETLPAARRRSGGMVQIRDAFGTLFRHRAFMGYALSVGLGTAAMISYLSASPFVIQDLHGVSAQTFGLLFAVNGIAMVTGSQMNAHLVGRFHPRRILLAAGCVWVLVAALLLVFVLADSPLWTILCCFAVLMGCWGFMPMNAVALGMNDHREIAGSASAILGLFQYGTAGVAAPLVGVAGRSTAVPMALMIFVLGALSVLSVATLTRSPRA